MPPPASAVVLGAGLLGEWVRQPVTAGVKKTTQQQLMFFYVFLRPLLYHSTVLYRRGVPGYSTVQYHCHCTVASATVYSTTLRSQSIRNLTPTRG